MLVNKNKVVSIHYTLKDKEGNVIDTSSGAEPLNYLHGNGNLIPGMEEGIEGKVKGDKLNLIITPDKGYGERNVYMSRGEKSFLYWFYFRCDVHSVATLISPKHRPRFLRVHFQYRYKSLVF